MNFPISRGPSKESLTIPLCAGELVVEEIPVELVDQTVVEVRRAEGPEEVDPEGKAATELGGGRSPSAHKW